MKTGIITLALAAAIAAPASAQSGTTSATDTTKTKATTATSSVVKVNSKVDSSVAATVKVRGDSAISLARANADSGEVSSIDLEMKEGKLVYEVKVLNKNKGASEIQIDAMTGEVVKDKKYGGLKAPAVHHQENNKLLNAKRDSAKTGSTTSPMTSPTDSAAKTRADTSKTKPATKP
jgi:uncharacterized membrane protein YkoI